VPAGFLHFAVCCAGDALSLSSMPRLRSTPNGFNEWLICETVSWARANRFARISLNFAPFAALLAPEAELSPLQRLERQALLRLKGRFQLDNLLLFNRKFFPQWQRRFVVVERRIDLPRVGIAALAAEAYLPFSGRSER
jgi:lysyl-tRNA synthetase class 2